MLIHKCDYICMNDVSKLFVVGSCFLATRLPVYSLFIKSPFTSLWETTSPPWFVISMGLYVKMPCPLDSPNVGLWLEGNDSRKKKQWRSLSSCCSQYLPLHWGSWFLFLNLVFSFPLILWATWYASPPLPYLPLHFCKVTILLKLAGIISVSCKYRSLIETVARPTWYISPTDISWP